MATPAVCKIDGCDKGGKLRRGWCASHYRAWRVNGAPLARRKKGPIGRPKNSLVPWLEQRASWDGDDCLIWPFSRTEGGYGKIKVGGKQTRASRVMCQIVHGPPPTPKHEAAHSCGRGHEGCVHPQHLRWATRKENAADAIQHGTWNHGERVPQCKLKPADVITIRSLQGKLLQREIAATFGVSRRAVALIFARKNWAWLQ